MYEQETAGMIVRVEPQFLPEESRPEDSRFVWAYTIEIENRRPDAVQLMSRYWRITDGNGKVEEVRGSGVVGKQPVLKPGETFVYTSGCPLTTPSGIMVGTYQMQNEQGEMFSIAIPAFSLDVPDAHRTLN